MSLVLVCLALHSHHKQPPGSQNQPWDPTRATRSDNRSAWIRCTALERTTPASVAPDLLQLGCEESAPCLWQRKQARVRHATPGKVSSPTPPLSAVLCGRPRYISGADNAENTPNATAHFLKGENTSRPSPRAEVVPVMDASVLPARPGLHCGGASGLVRHGPRCVCSGLGRGGPTLRWPQRCMTLRTTRLP